MQKSSTHSLICAKAPLWASLLFYLYGLHFIYYYSSFASIIVPLKAVKINRAWLRTLCAKLRLLVRSWFECTLGISNWTVCGIGQLNDRDLP